MPNANGIMNVSPPTLLAIMWAATESTPKRPISSVMTENMENSKNVEAPIGTPSLMSRQISFAFGRLNRANTPVTRIREYATTTAMITTW